MSPESLRYYPHFAAVPDDGRKDIAMSSEKIQFSPGDDLLTNGNPATTFCHMASGEVNVIYRLENDSEVVAETLVRGDAFGWGQSCWSRII